MYFPVIYSLTPISSILLCFINHYFHLGPTPAPCRHSDIQIEPRAHSHAAPTHTRSGQAFPLQRFIRSSGDHPPSQLHTTLLHCFFLASMHALSCGCFMECMLTLLAHHVRYWKRLQKVYWKTCISLSLLEAQDFSLNHCKGGSYRGIVIFNKNLIVFLVSVEPNHLFFRHRIDLICLFLHFNILFWKKE